MSTINGVSGSYNGNSYVSSLLNSGSAGSSSSSSSMDSLYDLLSKSYGVNTAVKTTYQTDSKIRSSGESLGTILESLMKSGSSSAFNQIGGESGNKDVATATVDGSKADASQLSSMTVNVGQTATAQVNSGNAVSTTGKAVSSGSYKFELKVGNIARELSVNVSSTDTNEDIQRKMVSAINDSKLGVTATIDYNSGAKSQTLKVTSNTTGNKNANGAPVFTLTDKTGSLVSKMGAGNVSKEAQNAIYSIGDGERQFSASNKIELENGVTLNLAGEGSTTIDFKKNGSAAADKVKELVNAINGAMSSATNSLERGSSRLFNDMFQMTKAYSSTLERIGINVSSGGALSIDEDKLAAAASDGSLEKVFQGGNNGFANRLDRISSNMKSSNFYADPVDTTSATNTQYYDKYASISSLLDMYY